MYISSTLWLTRATYGQPGVGTLQDVDEEPWLLFEWTSCHVEQRINVSSYLVLDLSRGTVRRIWSSHG